MVWGINDADLLVVKLPVRLDEEEIQFRTSFLLMIFSNKNAQRVHSTEL
jgi:hypothetical protein